MKDYIVFFTEGFDKYAIEKQSKAFPDAYISYIDSKPDYNKLYYESILAREAGYNNFYMLWEANEVPEITKDMQSEFTLFKETGALPYRVSKSLQENDIPNNTQLATNTTVATNNIGATDTSTINSNLQADDTLNSNTNVVDNMSSNGNNALFIKAISSTPKAEDGGHMPDISSVTYDRNHCASIFIWPINVYTGLSNMRRSLANLQYATYCDNNGRASTENKKSTSTVYTNKKGDWQRIIYITPSRQELNQSISDAAQMYKFVIQLAFSSAFPTRKGYGSGNPILSYLKDVLNKGSSQCEFGDTDEQSIISMCKKKHGAYTASKDNIAIFCPPSMVNYFSWCPRVVPYPSDTEPKKDENLLWVNALKGFHESIPGLNNNDLKANRVISRDFLVIKDPNNGGLLKPSTSLFNKLKDVIISKNGSLLEFYKYYLLYANSLSTNVYKVPASTDMQKEYDDEPTAIGKFAQDAQNFYDTYFKGLRHYQDLKAIRDEIGLHDTDYGALVNKITKLPKRLRDLKNNARDAAAFLPKRVKDKQERGIPLSDEEQKLVDQYNSQNPEDETTEKVKESLERWYYQLIQENDVPANNTSSTANTPNVNTSTNTASNNNNTVANNNSNNTESNKTENSGNQNVDSTNIDALSRESDFNRNNIILYMLYYFLENSGRRLLFQKFFGIEGQEIQFMKTCQEIADAIKDNMEARLEGRFAKINTVQDNQAIQQTQTQNQNQAVSDNTKDDTNINAIDKTT